MDVAVVGGGGLTVYITQCSGFPDVNPYRLGRRECVKVCDGQFCCCISEVIAPYIGMTL